MLELDNDVIRLITEITSELGLKGGSIQLEPLALDLIGDVLSPGKIAFNKSPNWSVAIKYPTGMYTLGIATADFTNLDQIKTYVRQELQKQMKEKETTD